MKANLPYNSYPLVTTKILGLLALLACTAVQSHADTRLAAVGPRPSGESDGVTYGYLKVYSATQETQWGEATSYYPHTGYRIYTADGKVLKWVDNHDTSIDEDPQKIKLAPGTYSVWALSDHDGYVRVRVVIKVAETTNVHLEEGRDSDREAVKSARVVKPPSGQVVGWQA